VHYNSRDDQKQGPSREGIRDRLGLATYRLEREDRNPKGTVSSFAVRFIGRYFILFFGRATSSYFVTTVLVCRPLTLLLFMSPPLNFMYIIDEI
jgi:hypothetical protein